jgi:hypothetical protein
MRIRQFCLMAVGMAALAAHAQAVVDLPGVRASASPSCVQPAGAASAGLSYGCLNEKLKVATPLPSPLDTNDVRHEPSNRLGLYNAAALGHRMGTNLGRGVEPARPPAATYPSLPQH